MLDALIDFFTEHVKPILSTEIQHIRRRGQTGHVVIKNGYEIKAVPPALAEKPARMHSFEDTEAFGQFIVRHFDAPDTEILANLDGITAASKNDWDRDQIVCLLAKTETYKEWTEAFDGKTMGQQELYTFLRKNRELVKDASRVLTALRELEVAGTDGVKMTLTETGMCNFVGKSSGVEIRGALPTEIVVSLPVYKRSTKTYEVKIDLLPKATSAGVCFNLDVPNLEEVRDQALDDELARLGSLLGEAFLISRGSARFMAG